MADLSKMGEKGKDALVALERLAHELPIARILIVFLLFCDCFIFVATGRSFVNPDWGTGKEISLGGVFLCIAAFSFVMTAIAPFCLHCVLWVWFNIGSGLVYAIKSRLPERERDRQSDVEEFPPKPTQWTEPRSYREKQLEKNLVSFQELHEYALLEQNPIALERVKECESTYEADFNDFKERSRTAYWSVMVSLLTTIDLFLGVKTDSTVLWTIIGKLKQFPVALWSLGLAYIATAIWPLVRFIRTDLEQWGESRTKPVFYPPLAQKLLAGVQRERREKELAARAFDDGWNDARPLEVVCAPRANTNTALDIAERLCTLIDYFGRSTYCMTPSVTPVRVSQMLGYDSVDTLENVFSGSRPLSFSEAAWISEWFGVNVGWLLEGKPGPFAQACTYLNSEEFFQALALDEITWGSEKKLYHRLLFILGVGKCKPTLVYGQREESAYRFDLLLDNVAIYEESCRSRAGLLHFCLAAAKICRTTYFSGRVRDHSYGIIDETSYIPKTAEQYQQILNGHIHLSWVVRELNRRPWVQDIWDLDFTRTQSKAYTPSVAASYQDFVLQMQKIGVTNNEKLDKYIDGEIAEIRSRYRRQRGIQESAVDA